MQHGRASGHWHVTAEVTVQLAALSPSIILAQVEKPSITQLLIWKTAWALRQETVCFGSDLSFLYIHSSEVFLTWALKTSFWILTRTILMVQVQVPDSGYKTHPLPNSYVPTGIIHPSITKGSAGFLSSIQSLCQFRRDSKKESCSRLHGSSLEIYPPRVCEGDSIWRKGLCRYN